MTAAYLPRNLRPEVTSASPSIRRARSSSVRSRPASSEIAGFEDNTSDGRAAQPRSLGRAASGPRQSPTPALGRRIYQKGLQTFVWKADDDNDDRLQFDVLYRREGETAWKALQARAHGPDLRVGHDVGAGRHLLREGGGVRRAVELARTPRWSARSRACSFDIDNTRAAHRAAAGDARGRADDDHVRRP